LEEKKIIKRSSRLDYKAKTDADFDAIAKKPIFALDRPD
jgi:hypothetical protein